MKQLLSILTILFSINSFARLSDDNLTQKEAEARKRQVKSVSYQLYFEIHKKSDQFKGRTTLIVELNSTKSPLSIDTMAENIESVKVNNKPITNFIKRKGSLDIPAEQLTLNPTIEINYFTKYSKEAHGFIKVIDPADQEEYLYTDFEPYYAHWLFPSLNQPDLKATYEVTVESPADWKIVHNDLVQSEEIKNNRKLTRFNKTKLFSTYLFFLGAGPWEEWNDNYKGLPLVIHSRKSVKKFMDAQVIFETTKKGLEFFNNYFGYPYPYPKYGQIFVPDFAFGAMENPGAVTFNEQKFLYRGPVSKTTMSDRDNVILHEMAHMWFGNLVTMKWWNDLWLNESFATYAANLGQERGLQSDFAGVDFLSSKIWGYWQDQLVTTHPIEAPIPDVRSAKGIFDGITYAKGASALKQLHFYVGEEGFRDGLRNYFQKYSLQNTLRKDFIEEIAKASTKNLNIWTKTWLQTSGPHRVDVNLECKENKITKLSLIQSKNTGGILSPHKVRFAFFKKQGEELIQKEIMDITYERARTKVPEAAGRECPDFILPNFEDKDYALFSLDKNSLKLAAIALSGLPDSLSRYVVWNILLQMVRDQKLPPETFFKMASEAIKAEKDENLLGILLGGYSSIREQYFTYLTLDQRKRIAPSLEKIVWDRFTAEKSGSSAELSFFDFYVSIAYTKEALDNISNILKANQTPTGFKLDADRRWALIKVLSLNNYPDAKKIILDEAKKDQSTMGKRYALAALVAIPDVLSKNEYLKSMLTPGKFQYSDLREAARDFFTTHHPELGLMFIKPYFERMRNIDWSTHDDYVSVYLGRLFPGDLCSVEVQKMSADNFRTAKKLTNIARKSWLESHDELERCVKVRKANSGRN